MNSESNSRLRTWIFCMLALLLLSGAPSLAAVDTDEIALSLVVIEADGVTASGFVVQADRYNGYVVTNAQVVADAGRVTVNNPRTGEARIADIARMDRASDYALLKVNGLNMPPLDFSRRSPVVGEVVWTAAKLDGTETISVTKGLLRSELTLTEDNSGWYQHSAGTGAGGSVLLNDCGQVLGLNFTTRAGDGSTRAMDLDTLKARLAMSGITVKTSASVCVSELARAKERADLAAQDARRAKEEAERAQQVTRELEQQLNQSKQSNVSLLEETRLARERSETAIRAAELAQLRADNTRRELEEKTLMLREETQALVRSFEEDRQKTVEDFQALLEAQQDAAASRERVLIGFSVALFVLLGIMLFFTRFRQAPAGVMPTTGDAAGVGRSNTEANHRGELSEYVLDGRDDDGIRYLLRISGDQLVNHEDGVIIGRNPKDSPYIINHADVSRKHARIRVKNNRVFIEDLGSTNGTSVNGQSIDDKGPVSIDNGDQIIIGSVVMKLRVMEG